MGEELRNALFVSIVAFTLCTDAEAADLWTFQGNCEQAYVKRGRPDVDMGPLKGNPFQCELAFVMKFDNGRTSVQFMSKRGRIMPPGFSGGRYETTENGYSLVLDKVYPERKLTGKTTGPEFKEISENRLDAEGYCVFDNQDFSKMSYFMCITKTIPSDDLKIVYRIPFVVREASFKSNFAEPSSRTRRSDGDFERIFQHTLDDKILPDGKHPVWIYFQSKENTVRIDMPSMDMCVVTAESSADMSLIGSKKYDVIEKSSPDWNFAHDIWKAAYQRYLIVGEPRRC